MALPTATVVGRNCNEVLLTETMQLILAITHILIAVRHNCRHPNPNPNPLLPPGDVVYVREAGSAGVEYAGNVLAVDGSRCLLLMPPVWWQRLEQTKPADVEAAAPLVHMRFGFDRTALQVKKNK